MAKKFIPRGNRSWPSIVGPAKLRASRAMARLEDLSRLAAEWVWETDAQGHITYLSERVKDSLGFIPEQIAGKTFQDLGVFIQKVATRISWIWSAPFATFASKPWINPATYEF